MRGRNEDGDDSMLRIVHSAQPNGLVQLLYGRRSLGVDRSSMFL